MSSLNSTLLGMDPFRLGQASKSPRCGHCKDLAPTYESVASIFAPESDCIVAKLDATAEPEPAKRYGITGYPTIKFFPKGENKEPIEYNYGRNEEGFVKFLNEKCGTRRVPGGGLEKTVRSLSRKRGILILPGWSPA